MELEGEGRTGLGLVYTCGEAAVKRVASTADRGMVRIRARVVWGFNDTGEMVDFDDVGGNFFGDRRAEQLTVKTRGFSILFISDPDTAGEGS